MIVDVYGYGFMVSMLKFNIEDYRPISLCNDVYKIIAMVIAHRVTSILSEKIYDEQFYFLEKIQIDDPIAIAQEILH